MSLMQDALPYVVLVVVYFVLSCWLARRKQRRNAAQITAIQARMIADYEKRNPA